MNHPLVFINVALIWTFLLVPFARAQDTPTDTVFVGQKDFHKTNLILNIKLRRCYFPKGARLNELTAFLQQATRASFDIDQESLKKAGVEPTTQFRANYSNIYVHECLDRILSPHQLVAIAGKKSITIMSMAKAQQTFLTREYLLSDLYTDAMEKLNPTQRDEVISLINTMFFFSEDPKVLKKMKIKYQPANQTLAIQHHVLGHQAITSFFTQLVAETTSVDRAYAKAEARIQEALKSKIRKLNLSDGFTLGECNVYLREITKVNVVLDVEQIKAAGLNPELKIKVRLENQTLEAMLEVMLPPKKLSYVVDKGFLIVTSEQYAASHFFIRPYWVEDLVNADDAKGIQKQAAQLAKELRFSSRPSRAEAKGTKPKFMFLSAKKVLVVYHNHFGHRAVASQLSLKRAQAK